MNHFKQNKRSNIGFATVFFTLIFLGFSSLFLFIPTVFAVQPQKMAVYALPTALNIPVKKVQKPVKAVLKKPVIAQARLSIPRIKVNAVIKDMGLTSDGAMAVPGNRVDVGWYSLGTRPGEMGSAVIGGHNRWDYGKVGIFIHLDKLVKGDVISIVDAKGASTSFVVREMRTYDALDTNTRPIFESESGSHLNLITCSGAWNPATNSYTTRLVVFTDLVQKPVNA